MWTSRSQIGSPRTVVSQTVDSRIVDSHIIDCQVWGLPDPQSAARVLSSIQKWYKLQCMFCPRLKSDANYSAFLSSTQKCHKLQCYFCLRFTGDTNYNAFFALDSQVTQITMLFLSSIQKCNKLHCFLSSTQKRHKLQWFFPWQWGRNKGSSGLLESTYGSEFHTRGLPPSMSRSIFARRIMAF